MAANGISTLPSKAQRKTAKIALAAAKRSGPLPGYRFYNVYVGTVSPTLHRPWDSIPINILDGGSAGTTIWDEIIDGEFAPNTQITPVDGNIP